MSRESNAQSKKHSGNVFAKFIVFFTCVVMTFGITCSAFVPEALAGDTLGANPTVQDLQNAVGGSGQGVGQGTFDPPDDYADQVIGRGKWDRNIITKSIEGQDAADAETEMTDMAGGVSKFLNEICIAIAGLGILAAVARFAGRGIYELLVTRNENDGEWANRTGSKEMQGDFSSDGSMPAFLKTGKERKGGSSSEWFTDMLIETGIYIAVSIGIGAILGLLLGLAGFIMNGIVGAAPDDSMTTFKYSLGGQDIEVNTK